MPDSLRTTTTTITRYARPRHVVVEKRGSASSRRLQERISDPAFVSRCLWIAYPSRSEHELCLRAARDLDRTPETIRRWIRGASAPRFADFWPVLGRVLERRADPATLARVTTILSDI